MRILVPRTLSRHDGFVDIIRGEGDWGGGAPPRAAPPRVLEGGGGWGGRGVVCWVLGGV